MVLSLFLSFITKGNKNNFMGCLIPPWSLHKSLLFSELCECIKESAFRQYTWVAIKIATANTAASLLNVLYDLLLGTASLYMRLIT